MYEYIDWLYKQWNILWLGHERNAIERALDRFKRNWIWTLSIREYEKHIRMIKELKEKMDAVTWYLEELKWKNLKTTLQ